MKPKMTVINAQHAMAAMYELYSSPSMVMVADGTESCLKFIRGHFEKDLKLHFNKYPNSIITQEIIWDLMLDGTLSENEASIVGSNLSFGPGVVYYKDHLTFKFDTGDQDHVHIDNPLAYEGSESYIPYLGAISLVQHAIKEEWIEWSNGIVFNEDAPDICDDLLVEIFNTPFPDYGKWLKRIYRAYYYGSDRYKHSLSIYVKLIDAMRKHQISFVGSQVYVNGELFDVSPYFN